MGQAEQRARREETPGLRKHKKCMGGSGVEMGVGGGEAHHSCTPTIRLSELCLFTPMCPVGSSCGTIPNAQCPLASGFRVVRVYLYSTG